MVIIMHDRKINRLSGFDYSSSRYYFVTMCVDYRVHSFGIIENKMMQLSPDGKIAQEQLNWLGRQYPYIQLISSVIMPNHIHVIIFINVNYYNDLYDFDNIGNGRESIAGNVCESIAGNGRESILGNVCESILGNGRESILGNGRDRSLHKIKPIPELIGAYKTTVSKLIHLSGDVSFKWQKSYHDHIIRNRVSLNRIKNYIETNPEKWDSDAFNQ